MANVVWRDDDIFAHEGMFIEQEISNAFAKFVVVHNQLKEAGAMHTIAVLAGGIPYHPLWVDWIKNRKDEFDIQTHGLVHMNFALPENQNKIEHNLKLSLAMIETTFGKCPTIFYPPWNETSPKTEEVCEKLGLRMSNEKIGLYTYCQRQGDVDDGTILNFHHWAEEDTQYLDQALKLWRQRQ